MAYTRSRARKQFDAEIRQLLLTIKSAFSAQCSARSVREYALCSGILLCSARLESYLEDLVGDWGSAVQARGTTTDKLPKIVRAHLLNQPGLIAAYRRLIVDEDETALLSRIVALIGQSHYDFAVDGRPLPVFSASLLYADRKYPSPKNLKRLFGRLGIGNPFLSLNRIARRNTEALLTSFNDLRTEMAHVGMPVGLSERDIKQRIHEVALIVSCIDRMFYSHVSKTVGRGCWTS